MDKQTFSEKASKIKANIKMPHLKLPQGKHFKEEDSQQDISKDVEIQEEPQDYVRQIGNISGNIYQTGTIPEGSYRTETSQRNLYQTGTISGGAYRTETFQRNRYQTGALTGNVYRSEESTRNIYQTATISGSAYQGEVPREIYIRPELHQRIRINQACTRQSPSRRRLCREQLRVEREVPRGTGINRKSLKNVYAGQKPCGKTDVRQKWV